MPLSDRNILITPNRGASSEPTIRFTGADVSSSATITLRVLNSGTTGILSFEGTSGQLFSLTDTFGGTVFSVNDISGVPSIEVFDTGEIRLAQYNGFVNIRNSAQANSTNTGALRVTGGVGIGGNLYVGGTINGLTTGTVIGTISTATQVNTVQRATDATHFITFVPDNNTSAASEPVYTTSSLLVNPGTGNVSIGSNSVYNVSQLSLFPGTARNGIGIDIGSTTPGTYTGVYLNRTASDGNYLVFDRGGTRIGTIDVAGTSLTITTNNTERIRINSSGHVGIGTTAPENSESWGRVLDVYEATTSKIIATTNAIQTGMWAHNSGFYGSPAGSIMGARTNHPLSLITNGNARVTILAGGNVGIGTTNPATTLHLSAATPTLTITSTDTTGTTIGNKGNRLLLLSDSVTANNGGEIVWAATDTNVDRWAAISGAINANSVNGSRGDIVFATKANDTDTALSERMRLSYNGNLGIGTTNPATLLDVNGDVTVADRIIHSGDTNTQIRFPAADTFTVETNGGERMRIDSFGQVGIFTTPPTTSTTAKLFLASDFSLVGANRSILGNIYYDTNWKYAGNGFGWGFREDNAGKLQMLRAANNTGGAGAAATVSLTDLFTFDLVNNRAGLGTGSPGVKLDVIGAIRASTTVNWGDGPVGNGNPRSLTIGYSGSNYGGAGYGINYTSTSDYHTYALNDIPSLWEAYDGIVVKAAAAGTVNNQVSWTTVLNARRSNSSLFFKGNTVLDSTNYTSYSPSLTGSGASGTWGINITGSAGSATSASSATTASQIDGIEFRNGNSSNPTGPDNITDNGTGYINSVSLFGQTDGALYSQAYSSSWVHQIFGDYRTGQLAVRGRNSGTWQSWRVILDSTNYTSYSPTLTGGGASGTWGISITGNAANVTGTVAVANGGTGATTAANARINLSAAQGTQVSGSGYNFNNTTPAYPLLERIVWNSGDTNMVNSPSGNTTGLLIASQGSHGLWNAQAFLLQGASPELYLRGSSDAGGGVTSWGTWRTVLHSSNYNSYSPTLTGTGASGTWGINITGSAASVTGGMPNNVDNYFNVRVIRNSNTSISNDGMYIGYANSNNGLTRIYGGGSSSNHIYIDGNADIIKNTGPIFLHSSNYNSYAPTLTGTGASGTWGINITGSAGSASSAGNVTNSVTFNNGGSGDASGTTYNGSAARTISYNTIGAPSTTGTGASGTWGISITGNAANITAYTINQNLGTGNQVTFDSVITGNNGNGTNVRLGDDAWIGDVNVANTTRLMGVQTAANAYLIFGNGDTTALGRAGTGALTYGGHVLLHANNVSSYAVTITNNSSLNSDSRNTRGVTRLYRRDDNSDFSVQTYWTGSRWRLYGYNGDTDHADTHVGYADSAGNASTVGGFTPVQQGGGTGQGTNKVYIGWHTSGDGLRLQVDSTNFGRSWPIDISGSAGSLSGTVAIANGGTGATSAANARTNLGIGTADNVTFSDVTAIRTGAATTGVIYFGNSGTRYLYFNGTNYEMPNGQLDVNGSRVLNAGNYTSYSPSLTGSGASGTWGINVTGSAGSVSGGLTTSNYNSYAPTLTGGGASGTWGINITGNAATVSNATTVAGYNFSWGYVAGSPYYTWGTAAGTGTSRVYETYQLVSAHAMPYGGGTFTGDVSFSRGSSARIILQSPSGDGRIFTNQSNLYLGAGDTIAVTITSSTLTCQGNITAFSDERLKKDWAPLPNDFLFKLSNLKAGTYTRIDTSLRELGVPAQQVQEFAPEVVLENKDGYLSIAYGNIALAAAVELSKETRELREKLAVQEKEISELKTLINSLLVKFSDKS